MTRVREMLERSRRILLDGRPRPGAPPQQRSRIAGLVGRDTESDVLAAICADLTARDLRMLDELLNRLEELQAGEQDPDILAQLYRIDHLATRLRRNGENLRVLAGRDAAPAQDAAVALVDVIRAALSSIEQYPRVELGSITRLGVVGLAADDIGRLLAELLDNATAFSPESTVVTVSAHLTERGSVMVRVEDGGDGMAAERLSALNQRLAAAPALDRFAARHTGFEVVRRLAGKHGVRVWLARRAPRGVTASVLLPPALLQEAAGRPARTTAGLPRRVPRDPDAAIRWPSADPARTTDERRAGHRTLLADLDDFAAGQQAARERPQEER
ncbi:sensor histidine kinase [Saccharopolyspora rosea]|uniref:histidine kinase n=1 Tax=Saccharopolyspora rosea TaxID=524884 RepID=A0ABW3FYA8_9PSEU|nr:ATP-binding protein [Saccharopolyspora rosea]